MTVSAQLPLDLPLRAPAGRDDFVVTAANRLALAAVDGWRDWPLGKLLLIGPDGAGKSHIARIWAEEAQARLVSCGALGGRPETGAVVVEDADRLAGQPEGERALLHLHNLVLAEGGRLLLTARHGPRDWGIVLPDLASRMDATPVARLDPPDDALLSAVLVKLFADRHITPAPRLIGWLVARMERSLAEAGRLVALLDARAMATGRPVGLKLAQEILSPSGEMPDED